MAEYAGAIDQGTTSSRFIVFDHDGQVVAIDQTEHEQIYPEPGWVEHDPTEIWQRAGGACQGALQQGRAHAARTSPPSASPTSARPPCCGTERPASRSTTPSSGRTPAPTRSASELASDGGPGPVPRKTGLPLATYFSGPKIRWLLDNVAGPAARAEAGELLFGTIDTWLHLEADRRATAASTSPTSPTPAAPC